MSLTAGQQALNTVATRINSRSTRQGVMGFDPTLLIQILPIFIQLIQSCKKPPQPAPTPTPASVSQDAWDKAWKSRYLAQDSYIGGKKQWKAAAVNRLAKATLKKKRADGTPVAKAEAQAIAIATLEEAHTSDVLQMALAIDEAGRQ